ncbi:MAG TPA: hypothetical protein VFN38_15215 [Gemmatimonadaceae bacterium]|nr:hypothetical protein [Gemmatimonadaceae bacterium]
MRLIERSPSRLPHALLLSISTLLAGCALLEQPYREAAPVYITGTSEQQAIFFEALTDYNIDAEREPIAITLATFPKPSIPDTSAPHMTIATMRLKPGHMPPASHRLIARITSDGDYPAMGIYAGANFVWRNSWDSTAVATWVTRVVPTKPSMPAYVLTRDPGMHEFTSGDAHQPRLVRATIASVAFAACLDDPMCPTGHCGYW